MSVMVATAYMEEAEGFDWLTAMDDGRVIATGSPAELRAKGNASTLDDAFINLLPEAKRAGHQAVIVPPRVKYEGPPAIEAEGLTQRFGKFTAVDHVSFRIEKGEIFGFLGSNGCGKSTTMKMLTGLLAAERRKGATLWSPARRRRHGDTRTCRLHDAGVLALWRIDCPAEPGATFPPVSPAGRPARGSG